MEKSNPDDRPKCLLEIGGTTLLARHLAQLAAVDVKQVDLVIGYEADRVIDHVGELSERPPVAFHFNPRFDQGSVISLLAARDALTEGGPVVIMDADVLYHPQILQRLFSGQAENCVLLDREFEPGEEPVKIAFSGGLIVEFRKQMPDDLEFNLIGESVGFFRFGGRVADAIAQACVRFEAEGLQDAPHEEVLRTVLLSDPAAFAFEDVTGLPWIEIDFPADVRHAEDVILPAIREDYPGY